MPLGVRVPPSASGSEAARLALRPGHHTFEATALDEDRGCFPSDAERNEFTAQTGRVLPTEDPVDFLIRGRQEPAPDMSGRTPTDARRPNLI